MQSCDLRQSRLFPIMSEMAILFFFVNYRQAFLSFFIAFSAITYPCYKLQS